MIPMRKLLSDPQARAELWTNPPIADTGDLTTEAGLLLR